MKPEPPGTDADPRPQQQHATENAERYRRAMAERIREPRHPTDKPDSLTEQELQREEKRVGIDLQRQELEDRKQDREERVGYARKLYSLIRGWLLAILALVLLQGFNIGVERGPEGHWRFQASAFELSDPVMLAVIGGTTANVLGLFFVVVSYLFKKPKADPSDPTQPPHP